MFYSLRRAQEMRFFFPGKEVYLAIQEVGDRF